ncbi:preprotein translocase subunit SecY [Egicoccus sp. AB-alg2]|uniref:preprotein translocase subunit SecY n=1 Tax=Egicoccus sp. AB-alg2 TaxID=3242693 RepID=UPI00359E0284
MLRAFVNAFKIPDLRRKLLFTLGIIAIYRLGGWIPVPGVEVDLLRDAVAGAGAGGIVGIINLFAGGALQQMAVFALGIMPYITASIIMQLLAVVIPKLEALQREGEQGRKKITQYTRYITIGLALLQSTTLVTLARNGVAFGVDVMPQAGTGTIVLMVLTLTAGTGLIMWLGELITQRGVGNGMSLLIYVSIISQFPSQLYALQAEKQLESPFQGWEWVAGVLLMGIFLTVAVVFMEMGQRRIPVQYARRQVGRRSYGGQSTYIPLKVNQSGVIPVIFASSLMYLPGLIANISGSERMRVWTETYLADASNWFYILTFAALTIFFAYFYTAIAFNPVEVADNMKRYGGFIPGIRPGRQTAEYLDRVLTRITLPGSLYLAVVAVLPFILLAVGNVTAFPLGGVSLLIMVGVALQTMQQIESQLMQRNYEGFLR